MLVIFAGLPGTGKTTLAREVARHLGAVHIRIDTIEQSIRSSTSGRLPVFDAGYLVAYAVAADNLMLGRTLVADSVNPLEVTRRAWLDVAARAGVRAVEIEVVCSDRAVHRARVERRTTDVPGLVLPTWSDVMHRDYEPWIRNHVLIDTASVDVPTAVANLMRALRE